MRTLTITYADAPKGLKNWPPFISDALKRAGFDTDRSVYTEIARNRKSIIYYQEDRATYEDVLDRLERIERLLNIN